jgi:HEAT repeat protein
VIDPLLAALTDAEASVREQAAWALGLKGDRRVIAGLLAALDDDAPAVRERAVWALGLKGDDRAVEPLVARLTDDHAGVREQAAWALGQRGDARAVEALKAAADRDSEPAVRDMARWSLALLDTELDAPIDSTHSGASFGEVVAEALKVIQTGRSDG